VSRLPSLLTPPFRDVHCTTFLVISRFSAVLFCTTLLAVPFCTSVRNSNMQVRTCPGNAQIEIAFPSERQAEETLERWKRRWPPSVSLRDLALLEFNLAEQEGGKSESRTTTWSLPSTIQRRAVTCGKAANPPRSLAARRVTSQINFFALETACVHSCQHQWRQTL